LLTILSYPKKISLKAMLVFKEIS